MAKVETTIRIFVGSSKESLPIAQAIHAVMDDFGEVTVWDQNVFKASQASFKSLDDFIQNGTDFAIIIYTPDDEGKVRDKETQIARDNVILELGLCVGCLGMDRTFIFMPKGVGDFSLPTDLDGINCVTYNPSRNDQNLVAAVSPGCTKITDQIKKLVQKNQIPVQKNGGQNQSSSAPKKMVHPKPDSEKSPKAIEAETKIISLLAENEGRQNLGSIYIPLDLAPTVVQYHLDNLLEIGLIRDHWYTNAPIEYSLTKEGRKFYVENILPE